MSPSNCMYGAAHFGDYAALRSKVGRTLGWLCAPHFREYEKDLLKRGYHFRTLDELRARGELYEEDTTRQSRSEGLVHEPEPQQQQLNSDDTGWDQEEVQLAHERAAGGNFGWGSHGSAAGRPAESTGNAASHGQIQEAKEIMETRPTGAGTESGGLPDRTPGTPTRGELDWPAWTEGAGYLSLTQEQREILQRPFGDNDVTIRYDGVVYAPWRKYWSRMIKAFAPFVPSIIPVGNPQMMGQEIVVGAVMTCQGRFIGKAWGSHRLEGQNDRMAYGDRIESAISDAISKIGKRLNMGEQLWDDAYRDYWKSLYAESYTSKGRIYWRRKAVVAVEEHEGYDPDFNHRGEWKHDE